MRIIKIMPLLLCGLIMFTSCVKEELSFGSVVEGEPTLMKFSLNASYQNESPSTRVVQDVAEENKFKDIRVLIFHSNGRAVTNRKVSYPAATTAPNLTIDTYSGNNRTICIVANAADVLDRRLAAVSNKTELLAAQATIDEFNNGISGKPLLMTAVKENLNILPGENNPTLNLQMTFVAAKVTLVVKDYTPATDSVTILKWNMIDGANNTFVIPNSTSDANTNKENQTGVWTTTLPIAFDTNENDPLNPGKKIATVTQYLFENRRGGRVDHQPLPTDAYPEMKVGDGNHMGKAWFAPKRATAFVIYAMHHTPTESKVIEATIFIGGNATNNYDIKRGNEYKFTVMIKGIDSISIDTNLEHLNEKFVVQANALDKMDTHPDFRPFMIQGSDGVASIEILDMSDRAYSDAGFDALWVKVSPLNLMYHQVKQTGNNGSWQQDGTTGSFVRAKYIPHHSVRKTLSGKGGWNNFPISTDNDDKLSFIEATHRMCYKITDIPFVAGAATFNTLYVYTDEFHAKGGSRSAKVKVSFQRTGSQESEVRIFTITQNGYLSIFNDAVADAGLAAQNISGNPGDVKQKFGVEKFEEVAMRMNPGITGGVQAINFMQWGFKDIAQPLYKGADRYRNGSYVTAMDVYTYVLRDKNNMPSGFGIAADSYRPMYGNSQSEEIDRIPTPYSGGTSLFPYYYPSAEANIYHPIYKSSAARYCHEKNRDMNGDGFIDASETKWYLPSHHELLLLWIDGTLKLEKESYWSATEQAADSSVYVSMGSGFSHGIKKTNKGVRVRCVRAISTQ